ncbi:MAG: hypothetical protein L3J79_12390, partial [Candidatus Marinimicrobia bacterium]|nr:hypothetical protein [Candidatus Neomarinimicrobiota bacterium]
FHAFHLSVGLVAPAGEGDVHRHNHLYHTIITVQLLYTEAMNVRWQSFFLLFQEPQSPCDITSPAER